MVKTVLDIDLPAIFWDWFKTDWENSYDFVNHEGWEIEMLFKALPYEAQYAIIQKWLMDTSKVWIQIEYSNSSFLGVAYPLPGCQVPNIFPISSAEYDRPEDAWNTAILYVIAKILLQDGK